MGEKEQNLLFVFYFDFVTLDFPGVLLTIVNLWKPVSLIS